MIATELRIGNIVKYKEHFIQIENLVKDEFWFINSGESKGVVVQLSDIEPIPLTTELLERCGFTKVGSNYEKDWLLLHTHLKRQTFDFLLYESGSGRLMATPILYLHQLQNLVFALTCKELEINLEEK